MAVELTLVSQSFAEVIAQARLTPEQLAEVKAAAANAIDPSDLFAAGPTSHSEGRVFRCEQALAEYAALGKKPPKATLVEHRDWQRRLAVARRRDQLHAERQAVFPGCLCLGFGGRYPQGGLTVQTADGRTVSDPTWAGFRDPCPCPLGVEHEARTRARATELRAEDQQRRVKKLGFDLKLPEGLGDTRTFETHPDQEKMDWIRHWYDGHGKRGLLLHGLNQRGKTTTAYLLALQAIHDGVGVVGLTTVDLMEMLTDTYDHDHRLKGDPDQPPQYTHQTLIKSLQVIPFLLLDDLGVEPWSDHTERSLYQILNVRDLPGLWTVITTNLTGREVLNRYGNRLASRIGALCENTRFGGAVVGPLADAPMRMDPQEPPF
jgi:DNA replication protein DnaC